MAIRFGCPHCGALAHVSDECVGRVASCARCGNMMTVPHETNSQTVPAAIDDEVLFIDDDRSGRWTRRLLFYLGSAVVVGVLVALLLPARESAREASRRMSCKNHLKQIALAMHNYHDVFGCLPPAYTTDEDGRPMHSWRVLLLPFIESSPLWDEYDLDEPWDSPNNLTVARQMPSTFRCPSSPYIDGLTNYVVVIGDPDSDPPQTMFTRDRSIGFGDVKDGTSNTILLAEVRTGVPWTKPEADLIYDQMTWRVNGSPASIGSHHAYMANVALCDGSVRQISNDMQSRTLRNLIQPADGNPIDEF